MTLSHGIILGLAGGATQMLPVSGSAHRLLLPWMLQWGDVPSFFSASVILGAVLGLLAHSFPQWRDLAAGALRRKDPGSIKLLRGVALASLAPLAAGLLLLTHRDKLRGPEPIASAMIFFGLSLVAADRWGRRRRDALDLGPAEFLALGCAQALSLAPGASLIGLSMTGGLVLGLRRAEASRLALLLAAPVLLGASLYQARSVLDARVGPLFLLGVLCSAASAFGAARLLRWYGETRDFAIFGLYRVGFGLVTLLLSTAQPPVTTAAKLGLAPPPRKAASLLSPEAARLRRHVVALAEDIGERSQVQRGRVPLDKGRDYVVAQFKGLGYAPSVEAYHARWMGAVKNGTTFYNVAVEIPAPGDWWVLGAHYDTAGTPGADDNASGVAVLLEVARSLKERPPRKPVRLVAFSTEEPPAFDTPNMGSRHDARRLKEKGVRLEGMISLEMLGYYDDRPGSQIYFPFLKWFIPKEGNFLALVSNLKSRGFLKRVKRSWRKRSDFPLLALALPELQAIRTSDHQGYWDEGYPALLLTDTASYRNPHYHEPTDLPDTLDYEAMARVTKALSDVLVSEGE
ncbi:MAG: M28 family peptidase [Elusimicrobia bacterium]|nr:M28 family peptidase [Elusimicrobiota bacterium]